MVDRTSARTAERRWELKQKLLRLAEKAIRKRGLGGLKARALAREAGCALGAIYNVFPDLDALVLDVNARTLADLDRCIARAAASHMGTGGPGHQPAVARLVTLATAYLDFAASNIMRWRALFEHRMADGRRVPDWYVDEQRRLFAQIEDPLRTLRPDLQGDQLALFARTVFSAVHGVVSLGLDEKLIAIPAASLREQLTTLVTTIGTGLLRSGRR